MCEFNQVYLEFVNKEVDKIDYKLNEFLYKEDIQTLKGTDLPEKYSYNNVELNGLEDRIIAYYAQDPKYKPFHRKLIKPIKDGTPFGNGNELCDLAFQDHEERYLVSTKVSMDTDPFLKCIDQSIYSLNILRNPESFELDGIGDYLNPDYIALHIVLRKNYVSNKTKELKNDSHIKKVEKEQFKFSNLRSDLLKSKLLEWRTQVRELGLKPIVFIDVLDMENQRLFETA